MKQKGFFDYANDKNPIFEYYGFWNKDTNMHEFAYLYVPVIKE